jgi:hypothetical protein
MEEKKTEQRVKSKSASGSKPPVVAKDSKPQKVLVDKIVNKKPAQTKKRDEKAKIKLEIKEEKAVDKSPVKQLSPPQEKLNDSSSKEGHFIGQTTLYKGALVAPNTSSS